MSTRRESHIANPNGRTLVRIILLIVGGATLLTGCSDPKPQTMWEPMPGSPPTPQSQHVAAVVAVTTEESLTPAHNPTQGAMVRVSSGTDTLTAENLTIAELVALAYRTPETREESVPSLSSVRIITNEPLPSGTYDVRIKIEHSNPALLRQQLRSLLNRQLGINGRVERRTSDALVLTRAKGEVPPAPAANPPLVAGTTRESFTGTNLYLLAEQLEQGLRCAVATEARLIGPYKLFVDTPPTGDINRSLDVEATRQALRAQLGLDLVPGQRTLEYVIVE